MRNLKSKNVTVVTDRGNHEVELHDGDTPRKVLEAAGLPDEFWVTQEDGLPFDPDDKSWLKKIKNGELIYVSPPSVVARKDSNKLVMIKRGTKEYEVAVGPETTMRDVTRKLGLSRTNMLCPLNNGIPLDQLFCVGRHVHGRAGRTFFEQVRDGETLLAIPALIS